MSSNLIVAAALMLAMPAAAFAQSVMDRPTSELLVMQQRLDALLEGRRRVIEAHRASLDTALSEAQKTGRVVRSGAYAVIAPAAVTNTAVRQNIAAMDSILSAFPIIPESFIRAHVFIIPGTARVDEALRAAQLHSPTRLEAEWRSWHEPGTLYGRRLLTPLVTAYRASLDSAWQAWAPIRLAAEWGSGDDQRAVQALATPQWAIGSECLARRASSCRGWLGLDQHEDPIEQLYTPEERRTWVSLYRYRGGDIAENRRCLEGDDAACLEAARGRRYAMPPLPSPELVRGALLRAVHSRHGSDALHRALADSAGSIGERLSRATGEPVDSLALQAREWILSHGQPERVRAGAGELSATLVFALIMVALATRSGRWR